MGKKDTLVRFLDQEGTDREQIIAEHFKNVPFNQEVSEGKKSYDEPIKWVMDFYKSWIDKVLYPDEHEALDVQVEGLIRAINEVGLYRLDPSDYSTVGWKKKMKERETGVLGGVGLAGGVFSVYPVKTGESKIPLKSKIGVSLTSLLFGYVGVKIWHYRDMNKNLALLETAGKETEAYLRNLND